MKQPPTQPKPGVPLTCGHTAAGPPNWHTSTGVKRWWCRECLAFRCRK